MKKTPTACSSKPIKHYRLSLEKNYAIVMKSMLPDSSRPSTIQLGKDYGVRKQAISYILKQKDKVIAAYEKGSTTKRKILKGPRKYQEIEIRLLDWFGNLRADAKEITGNILLTGAKIVAKRMGFDENDINKSWIQ